MLSKPARKYFENYAVVADGSVINTTWDRAVVIPARRESESLFGTIQSIHNSSRSQNLKTLIVVVLNGSSEEREFHLLIEQKIREYCGPLVPSIGVQIFNLDRPGVGYARKVGMDYAAQLFFSGSLRSPWLRTTDADVVVEDNYLTDSRETAAAEIYDFEHTYENLDDSTARAHCIYDIYLRYYQAGLAYAQSPYAFFTIGSTISVHADSYVEVRGFSDRDAGEDFYLLNKLAKVGRIHNRADGIKIQGRVSDRVPFGTGHGTKLILNCIQNGLEHNFYDPRVFTELQTWLETLNQYAEEKDLDIFHRMESKALSTFAANTQILTELAKLPLQTESLEKRRRHTASFFDSFRTLKLLHYIRDHFYPSIPWHQALLEAPFMPFKGPIDPKSPFELGRQVRARGV